MAASSDNPLATPAAPRVHEQPFGDNKLTIPTGAPDTDANHYAFLDTDKETATDHADFRQYSNAQGRWMAPDPYDGSYSLGNPQSLNRYVYAANSPLSAIDPTGRECVWDDGSYDDNNDPETGAVDANGQHSNCTNAGGTWVDHANFAGMPDWCSPDEANAGSCGYDTSLPDALWVPSNTPNSVINQAVQNFIVCLNTPGKAGWLATLGFIIGLKPDIPERPEGLNAQMGVSPSDGQVAPDPLMEKSLGASPGELGYNFSAQKQCAKENPYVFLSPNVKLDVLPSDVF
jgi:RHS repeat-associated protein